LLFFDGECGLCDRAVHWTLNRDKRGVFQFAPLQGETAQRMLGTVAGQEFDTLVLVDGAGRHERSTAALRICLHLGWPWRALLVLWLVPRPVRDSVYDWVARNRKRWFGGKEACRLPTPSERARFLA
jgi:predicted DCC family thiol-disulfide oxidoreductase YuxK